MDAPATDFDWPPPERDGEWTADIGSEWQAFQDEASRAFSERHPDAAPLLPEPPRRRRWLFPSIVDATMVLATSALLVWWVQSRSPRDAAALEELPPVRHAAEPPAASDAGSGTPATLQPGATIVVTYPVDGSGGTDRADKSAANAGDSPANGRSSTAPVAANRTAASSTRETPASTAPNAVASDATAPEPGSPNPSRTSPESTSAVPAAAPVPAPEQTRLARRDDLALPSAAGSLNVMRLPDSGGTPSPPASPAPPPSGAATPSPTASISSASASTGAPSSPPAPDARTSAGSNTTEAAGNASRPPARPPADEIRRVLARYEAALEGLDVQQAAALFAKPDTAALQRAFAQLRRQEVEFDDCDVTAASTVATAVCKGTLRYVPAVGSSVVRERRVTWSLQLAREGDEWQILRLQAR